MKVVILRGGANHEAAPELLHGTPLEPSPTSRQGVMALSDQGQHWALLNVAPNVAHQLFDDRGAHHPPGLSRHSARSVVLTDAQVDHVSGLLSLREGAPIDLYVTPAVFEVLSQAMPVLQVLQHYCGVHWHVIPVAGETLSANFKVRGLPGLDFTAFATEGIAPPYLPEHETPSTTGLSIALAVRDRTTGQRLFCAPGAQTLGETELDWMRDADCVMVDEHATWPQHLSDTGWRAHRKVLMQGNLPGVQRICPDGFESAYDGMVIDL